MRTAHPIATKLGRYISLIKLTTWFDFGEIMPRIFLAIFFRKIFNPFSPVQPSICHILGMVGPIDVKQKEMRQLDVTLTRVPLTLTCDLWPWIFKAKLYLGYGRGKTPEANFFKLHMLDLWVWEFFWHPYRWPWDKVTKLPNRDAIYLVPMIKWEPLIQSLQIIVGISPSSCFPPD